MREFNLAIGDPTMPPWGNAPEWHRASMINGVFLHVNSPCKLTPEHSHDNWCKQREAEGWIYGPEKDIEKREHPCLMPFMELPDDQRRKDALFINIVRALWLAEEIKEDVQHPHYTERDEN